MKEEIEKLLSHYQIELLQENGKNEQDRDKEKIRLMSRFIDDLKEILNATNNDNNEVKKNKSKKHTKMSSHQEYMKNPNEPELITKKKHKGLEDYGF